MFERACLRISPKTQETDPVCHAFLTDTGFYQLLTRIDASIAEEVRARGCDCGGVLHSARYPRKPRGVRGALDASYESRLREHGVKLIEGESPPADDVIAPRRAAALARLRLFGRKGAASY